MKNKFSKNLKILRGIKKISQSQLAKELHVSQATINLWENKQREPTLSRIISVANYFDVSLEELINKNI